MAALVKAVPVIERVSGVQYLKPTKVADANETDLSTPDTSIEFDARGWDFFSFHVIFANYTSVTVKVQETVDGTNWQDITTATTSTSNTIVHVTRRATVGSLVSGLLKGQRIRLSIAGTLSGSADTLEVWAYGERLVN